MRHPREGGDPAFDFWYRVIEKEAKATVFPHLQG
jgi:hypothetical protein